MSTLISCGSSANCAPNQSGADTYAYPVDRLGHVVAVTHTQTGAIERYVYSPYGVELRGDESGNPFRYTGRRYDAETGLYFYRARYYDPELGRFLQTDPIGYADQMNLYAYVGNDPVNATDPTGMCESASRVEGGGGSTMCSTIEMGAVGRGEKSRGAQPAPNQEPAQTPRPANDNYRAANDNQSPSGGPNRNSGLRRLLIRMGLLSAVAEQLERSNDVVVYRGLSVGDVDSIRSRRMIVANNPGANLTIEDHILGRNTQFISGTLSQERAEYFATHGSNPSGWVIAMNGNDLYMSGNLMIPDRSALSPDARRLSNNAQELMILGPIWVDHVMISIYAVDGYEGNYLPGAP